MSILSGVGVKEHGFTSPAVDGTETVAGLSTALAYGGFSDGGFKFRSEHPPHLMT